MLKLFGFLVILCVFHGEVSCQRETLAAITKDVTNFKLSMFKLLSHHFNSLQDHLHRQFNKSHIVFSGVQNSLISASQKIPYHTIVDTTLRESFAENLAQFQKVCTRPAVQYIQDNTIFPLFDYDASVTPLQAVIKPITDSLDQVLNAARRATNETCLADSYINLSRFQLLYNPTLKKIKECVTSSLIDLRTYFDLLSNAHTKAIGLATTLVNEVESCTTADKSDTAASCAAKVNPYLCVNLESKDCETCVAIRDVRIQANKLVYETQNSLNTCFGKLTMPNVGAWVASIESCQIYSFGTALGVYADQEEFGNEFKILGGVSCTCKRD